MQDTGAQAPAEALDEDDARLAHLGYRPQLNRVLGLFANFSVAFTYLSPMVGIFSLFVLGLGTGGPAYIWLTWIPVAGMLLVALVFGELASHYPVAGALYQYSKYTVGRRFGWFVGWFYGIALLVTVASVDTGAVTYVVALGRDLFGWNFNPASHIVILIVTLSLLALQTTLNTIGAKVMGRVAQLGVYVEILGTFGIAIVLGIYGFHHGLGFLTSTQNVQHAAGNPLGLNFGGSWIGAALVAVLAPVYIFYGFESAGDISEETRNAGRQVPRAMRLSLLGNYLENIKGTVFRQTQFAEFELRMHEMAQKGQPITGDALDTLSHRPERHGDDGGGCDRQGHVRVVRSLPDRRADADHHRDVDTRDERGEGAEHQCLVDDEVDVVEPVLQDRHPGRDGDQRHERGEGPLRGDAER